MTMTGHRGNGLVQKEEVVKLAKIKIIEQKFGDIEIIVWRDSNGVCFVTLEHGHPQMKTFTPEHFLLVADKVAVVAEELRKRVNG